MSNTRKARNSRRTAVVMAGVAATALAAGLHDRHSSTFAVNADLTAVRVSSVNGAVVKGKPAHPPIMNHFKPRLRQLARSGHSQTHR
jgi:hypothetical protein